MNTADSPLHDPKKRDAYESFNQTPPQSVSTADEIAPKTSPAPSKDKDLPTSPTMTARFRFIRRLGVGSQAHVYLAERLEDGKLTAIKQLRIDSVKTWKEYTLFHREAEVLSKLDIPGVVKFYEACDCLDDDPPCSYIVQEYIEGPTLKEVLKSGYRFSLAQICELALQILDIIQKLQKNDPPVIHRDIKPSNIILKTNDLEHFQAYLIDFGAVSNPQVQSGGSTIAGTYGYMSPEQNIGRAVPSSDTYALGVLVAFLLSGVEPLEMMVKDLRLIIDPYLQNHPTAIVQTLRRMIEPDIKSRLSDIPELQSRFENFKKGYFSLNQKSETRLSDDELLAQLRGVKYLCQPQNIDIWQALPDLPQNRSKAPRPLFKSSPKFAQYPVASSNEGIVEQFIFYLSILRVMLMFAGLYAILSFPLIIILVTDNTPPSTFKYLGCALYAGLMLFITIFLFQKLTNFREFMNLGKHTLFKRAPINTFHRKAPENCPEHYDIYSNGFKTIATVTMIEFITPNDALTLYTAKKACFSDERLPYGTTPHLRIEAPPTFRIWYKFNPPDDDKTADIIHSIDTHTDPTGRIKIGDPLPILYDGIKTHSMAPIHVMRSMPYPLPFADLNASDDYLGKTRLFDR